MIKSPPYGAHPFFYIFLGLIGTKNHLREDNLKSDKHLENIEIVSARQERLGWAHATDEDHLEKESVRASFMYNVVYDPSASNRSVCTSSLAFASPTTSAAT